MKFFQPGSKTTILSQSEGAASQVFLLTQSCAGWHAARKQNERMSTARYTIVYESMLKYIIADYSIWQ